MGYKHNHSMAGLLKDSRVGAVGFCCESCCPMLGGYKKKKNLKFSQVIEVYSVFVCLIIQLYSPSNVCVWSGPWTHNRVHTQTQLTFRLHHTRHSCLVFTALWYGCSVVKPSDPILAWANSPTRLWTNLPVGTMVQIMPRLHHIVDTHIKSANTGTLPYAYQGNDVK